MSRTRRCPNCHKTTTNKPLCEACQVDREAMREALRYMWDILHLLPMNEAFSADHAICKVIRETRRQSPLIVQAVLDQVRWMDKPDYESIAGLLQSETLAVCGGAR